MVNIRKVISAATAICFYFSSTVSYAALQPLSLSQMFSYASSGNVQALRAARQRGMDIDTVDRNGDTALCYAIKRNNIKAYNALRAAGANPRHGCTHNISRQQYDSFMESSRVVNEDESSRAAYNKFNKGEFVFSKKVLWTAGLLLAGGGVAALALSGGGGGGGGGKGYKATNDNMGDFVGQTRPGNVGSDPWYGIYRNAQNGATYTNSTDISINNDNSLSDGRFLTDLLGTSFSENILEYAKYIQAALKAYTDSTVMNNAIINLGDATVGMIALGEGAKADNNNKIQIVAESGTIGMVASDFGEAKNTNDISISFKSQTAGYQVYGMYADTMGTALNSGTIKTVSSDAKEGSMYGMHARIINQEASPNINTPTKLINDSGAAINLSTVATADTTNINIYGMGSMVDKSFKNGQKLLSRAGYVDIENKGLIDLKLSLVNNAEYGSSIRAMTGGIVGIVSDANTTATNKNGAEINVEIETNDPKKGEGAQAGMLSVRGGTAINEGDIYVKGSSQSYGMIAIRGDGTNSELDSRKPTITNKGNINIDSLDSYGMISLHGGLITNSSTGYIILEKGGAGMQSNAGTLTNDGFITMNNGGNGIIIVKNETGEGSTNYDTLNTKVYNNNTITINNANSSYGIKSEFGTINNDGSINLINTSTSVDTDNYGIYAEDGVINNAGNIGVDIVNTGTTSSYGISSNKANINNISGGVITIQKEGIGINTQSGKITNYGIVNLNSDGIGIKSGTGSVANDGTINITGTGHGINSTTGTVTNTRKVNIVGNTSTGIESSNIVYNGTASNNINALISLYGKNNIGINGNAATSRIYNYGKIYIESDIDGDSNFGIKVTSSATVNNSGNIELKGNSVYINNNIAYGILGESGTINSAGQILISGFYGNAIITTSGIVNNSGTITINDSGYGIQGSAGSSTVNTSAGVITISGTQYDGGDSVGMYTDNGTARNDGEINISDYKSFAMNVIGSGQGVNRGKINLSGDDNIGMNVEGETGIITNDTAGIINVLTNDGYGMTVKQGTAYNKGKINLNSNNSMGIFVEKGDALNTGTITSLLSTQTGNFGMVAGNGLIENAVGGKIILYEGTGMQTTEGNSSDTEDDAGQAVNRGDIEIIGGSMIDVIDIVGMQSLNSSSVINASTGTITTSSAGMGAIGNSKDDDDNVTASSKAINSGTINSNGGVGMYAIDGGIAENRGTINSAGISRAMWASGEDSKSTNMGTINLTGSTFDKIGMYASGAGVIVNAGTIKVNNGGTGMSADGANSIAVNNGQINIVYNGTQSYGMNAMNGGTISNNGYITFTGTDNTSNVIGLFAEGTGSKVYNNGTISIQGVGECNGDICGVSSTKFVTVSNGASYVNGGLEVSSTSVNFNERVINGGKILIAKNGSFEAPEISGTVYADASIVQNSFETSYVNENSFLGEDKGIDLLSDSFLFNANLVTKDDGRQDIVMTMKDFGEVMTDNSLAEYLNNAYKILGEEVGEELTQAQKNANKIFNEIKAANNQNGLSQIVNNQLGLDFIPSLSRQNLEAVKSLNRQINNSIFSNDDPDEVIAMVGYDFLFKDQESSGAVSGYEEKANSVYGLIQKRDNNFSYGIGVTITKLTSDYDNLSKRDDTLIHVLAPLKYDAKEYTFVSAPRIGYGWGDYERYVSGSVHKADTENYYYGVTNEIRKDIDFGFITIEPTAEFNVLGIYQTKTKENQQLTVKSSNNLSIEGGLGLYAKKLFEINDNNSVRIRLGGTFYQEFGDPHANSRASLYGMPGYYNMKGYEADKSRGVVSGRMDYYFKSLNLFAEASKLIERDGSYDLRAGIEYRF